MAAEPLLQLPLLPMLLLLLLRLGSLGGKASMLMLMLMLLMMMIVKENNLPSTEIIILGMRSDCTLASEVLVLE